MSQTDRIYAVFELIRKYIHRQLQDNPNMTYGEGIHETKENDQPAGDFLNWPLFNDIYTALYPFCLHQIRSNTTQETFTEVMNKKDHETEQCMRLLSQTKIK